MNIIVSKRVSQQFTSAPGTLLVLMRTMVVCPSKTASICVTNKIDNSWEQTKLYPSLQIMRCANGELTTFLVVAAFNPDKTLHNPST